MGVQRPTAATPPRREGEDGTGGGGVGTGVITRTRTRTRKPNMYRVPLQCIMEKQ